jgi:hypothetical protein
MSRSESLKKLSLATVILLIVVSLLVLDKIRAGYKQSSDDYVGYWAGVQYVSRFGGGDFYSKTGEAGINAFYKDPANGIDSDAIYSLRTRSALENVQTPLIYAFVAPLSSGKYLQDRGSFNLAATIFFVAGMILLLQLYGFGPEYSLALLFFVLLVFYPLLSDYTNSNFSRFMFGFFSLALFLLSRGGRRGRFLAGFILWFAVLIKPTIILAPVFLAVSRVARRQWSELRAEAAGSIAGVAVGLAVGALYFGHPGVWLDWLSMAKGFSYQNAPFTSFNLALPSMLYYKTGKDLALPVIASGLLLTGYLVARLGVLSRETHRDVKGSFLIDLQAATLGLAAYPLFNKLAWHHYFVLTLPLAALLLSPRWLDNEKNRFSAASLAGFFALTTLPLEFNHNQPAMVAFAFTWGATLLLFLLASRKPYPSSGEDASAED